MKKSQKFQLKPQKKNFSVEQRVELWEKFDKEATKGEKTFIDVLQKYFTQQESLIVKKVKGYTRKEIDPDSIDDILNWSNQDELLVTTMTPAWTESYKAGITAANESYGMSGSFSLLNPTFKLWVEQGGLDEAKAINDTTKTALRSTLSEGIQAGEGIPKLRRRVESTYSDAKGYRAERIARTETHNTVGMGNFHTYKNEGVKEKQWMSKLDGRVRSSHRAINREVVKIDEAFSNGLEFPGDSMGDAKEVVNCRCVLLPVIKV